MLRGAALLALLTLTACGGDGPTIVRFDAVDGADGFRFRHELPGGRLDTLPKAAMGGFAVLDADGDGRMDLYFVNGGWHADFANTTRPERPAPNRLLRNLGGGAFEDITETSGTGDIGFGMGACVGDFDNDGHADLFVSNYGGSVLYRNRGDGTFEDVTEAAGIEPGFHAGAAFADVDRDGFADLFIAQYIDPGNRDESLMLHAGFDGFPPPRAYEPLPARLYRNRGDGTFEDVTQTAGVGAHGKGMGVLATDVDDDGWIDLVVANDTEANFVWRNRGDGTFEDIAAVIGIAYGVDGDERASMGVNAGDLDGDGRLDLAIPDTAGGSVYVARKQWFTDRASEWGLVAEVSTLVGWTDVVFDADNDGHLDLYKTHGDLRSLDAQTSFLMRADPEGGFERMLVSAGADVRACARGAVATDLDDDGRLDLVVLALEGKARLLWNSTEAAGGWIRLRLEGTVSNRMALGAKVTGTVDGRPVVGEVTGSAGYLCGADPRVHFGLGDADALEGVTIRWPNGRVQELGDLEGGREHRIVEPK